MTDSILWRPTDKYKTTSAMYKFLAYISEKYHLPDNEYYTIHKWSVNNTSMFWAEIWDWCDIKYSRFYEQVVDNSSKMPGAKWFSGARLNFAENLLRRRDDHKAIIFRGEDSVKREMTYAELYEEVRRVAAGLRKLGVKKNDKVAAFMPNMPETVIGMLATASIGAVWSSTSPDFGTKGVLDRFSQIEPKVIFAADGYFYKGKAFDSQEKLKEILEGLPSLEAVVMTDYTGHLNKNDIPKAMSWDELAEPTDEELTFEQLPFDHPLYIMYSSGTTGVPKCIVHGAGGTLLQHLKEHKLHSDVRPGDRLFYFTTCGWMMWNWLVSGLASGATLLLYDGSPFAADGDILFDYADAERMTHFGTSAKFIDHLAKIGRRPRDTHSLATVRAIMSTGSPLVPEGFAYVYDAIKADVCLSSISGGTDILSCFVLGSPVLPVWSGEIQCRGLGMAVDVFDENGRPVREEKGELVCTKPFPSMPIGFWGDVDGAKYHAAYFERFENIWCHGDFCEITAHGGLIIHGRSDATLNPGGVRIGTAEIYRQVEKLDEVVESLVIGQDWDRDVRVVLFVRLREGLTLDDELVARIRKTIRDNTTPRHVPAKILQVGDIPRTKSGKIVELAVRNIVHGRAVKNVEALANPEALQDFRDRGELTS